MNKLIQHHIKYEELHGVDEIVMLTRSEHKNLHDRLRNEGKCNVSVDELRKISSKAHERTESRKAYARQYRTSEVGKVTYKRHEANRQCIGFNESLSKNVFFAERIRYNCVTGSVGYTARFQASKGYILPIVEVS